MPRLPSIEPNENLGDRPIPQPQVGAVSYNPATGGEFARGAALADFGQQVEKTTTEYQTLINETRAKDADAAFTQAAINMTYDPQNGYYTKLGKDAVEGYVPAMNAMQAKFKEIRDSLPNGEAQRQYDAYAMSTMRRELISMAGHAAQQNKQWQLDTSNSRIKVYQESAANNYTDDTAFGQAVNTIKNEVVKQGQLMGWDNATIAANQAKQVSAVWSERIQRQMLNDPLGAQKSYQANIAAIAPEERPVLERALKSAVLPVQAANDANAIMAKDLPKDGTPMTATAVRANLRKWMDAADEVSAKEHPDEPLYRDMVVNKIAAYTGKITMAEEAAQRNARDTIARILITPKPDGTKVSDLGELLANPGVKEAWTRMEPMQQSSVLIMLEHNAKGQDPPETPEAQNTWHELRGLAYTDPEAFKNKMADPANFKKLATTLPHVFMNELISLDSSLDKASAKDLTLQNNAKRIHAVTDGLLQQAGFPLPKKDEKRQAVLDAYQSWTSRMLDQVQQFTDEHKRRPNDIELRQLGQQLLVQGYEAGSGHSLFGKYTWGQKQVRAFEEPDIGKLAVRPPDSEVPKITAALTRKYGRPPTQQEIDQLYAVKLMERKQ